MVRNHLTVPSLGFLELAALERGFPKAQFQLREKVVNRKEALDTRSLRTKRGSVEKVRSSPPAE